jgi:hypothetical protein
LIRGLLGSAVLNVATHEIAFLTLAPAESQLFPCLRHVLNLVLLVHGERSEAGQSNCDKRWLPYLSYLSHVSRKERPLHSRCPSPVLLLIHNHKKGRTKQGAAAPTVSFSVCFSSCSFAGSLPLALMLLEYTISDGESMIWAASRSAPRFNKAGKQVRPYGASLSKKDYLDWTGLCRCKSYNFV